MANMDHWDVDQNGRVQTEALVGWQEVGGGPFVLLRLTTAESREHLERRQFRHQQLHLSPDQCRTLARDLCLIAETVERVASGEGSIQ